mgnify:CR=1 FL=1
MTLAAVLAGARFPTLVSPFSVEFFAVFLPIFLVLYSLLPAKRKRAGLLAASLLFFWLISGALILYLFLAIFAAHYFGLWLSRLQERAQEALAAADKEERKRIRKQYQGRQRAVLLLSAAVLLGTLLELKYSGFALTNINHLLRALHSPAELTIRSYLMPVGISFYTMQTLSYLIDVYRREIPAEENIFRLGLFISFFPQIAEGPICRYGETADQLWNAGGIRYENLKFGLQRILYGMIKKIVVADRLNPLVRTAFGNYWKYDGGVLAFAAVCYTIQLYMDFSGSMDVVIGVAEILGIRLPENFRQPFFSRSVSEFWKRWHITLGTWFRDYVFYPVTISGPMKTLTRHARKALGQHYGPMIAGGAALLCVWVCNGLWHGSAWQYLFFGMYHFTWILIENLIGPPSRRLTCRLHLDTEALPYRVFQIVRTGILVVIGEMFFRAEGVRSGLRMLRQILTGFTFRSFNGETVSSLGVDKYDLEIVAVTVVIVFLISLASEKGIRLREALDRRNVAVRWGCMYAMALFLIVFGAYGGEYAAVDPMYAQF